MQSNVVLTWNVFLITVLFLVVLLFSFAAVDLRLLVRNLIQQLHTAISKKHTL